jgi:hypothetical protein
MRYRPISWSCIAVIRLSSVTSLASAITRGAVAGQVDAGSDSAASGFDLDLTVDGGRDVSRDLSFLRIHSVSSALAVTASAGNEVTSWCAAAACPLRVASSQ